MPGDPYRSADAADERAAAAGSQDQGIVGDIIEQFADSYAFLRELVQNAIDAGTKRIDVRISREGEGDRARVSVTDRGEGMTRDVIENQLLVLFRSTKETDHGKIGKFGIGFASVLSPDPEIVIVRTAREGRRLELHLARDLTYRLFEAGRSEQSGTAVELELRLDDATPYETLVDKSREALVRWCRHALVPIELVVDDAAPERIDRPLALEHCPVFVRDIEDGGQLVVLVGVPRDSPAPRTEFFNHGLALHATGEALIRGKLHVKIQDSRLGHTLTRDNVRRDAAFKRAVSFADFVALGLYGEATRRIAAAAETRDDAEHGRLIDDCLTAGLQLEHAVFRLASGGVGDVFAVDRVWATAQHDVDPDLGVCASRELGVPIFACGASPESFARRVETLTGKRVTLVEQELTRIVIEAEPEAGVVSVLAIAAEIIAKVHRKIPVLPARFTAGANIDALSLIARTDGRQLNVAGDAQDNPFARLRRPTLAVNVAHPTVARAAAHERDPRVAGSLLARAILLRYGQLTTARSEALLDDGFGRLDAGGR